MIIKDIVTQHAEEAAFLWFLRDAAVRQPHYNLKDLAELDERVEAHLDGLRIAGNEGWEVCKETFSFEDSGEVFAGSVLAFESGDEERLQTVEEAVKAAPELSKGMVSALGWLSYLQAKKQIQTFLNADSALMRRVGIAASAVHRQDPGLCFKKALSDADPCLRARACKAVGELARKDLLSEVMTNINDGDAACRFYAAWTALLLGKSSAMPVLQAFIERGGRYAEKAAGIVLRQMQLHDAHAWQQVLARRPEMQRLLVQALGVIGDPVSMEGLIVQMETSELARIAGESFSMITGIDIAYEDLEGEWPEGFEVGPTENPEDDDVALDPDEDLPWPNPELIERWWYKHKKDFQNGMRHLCGKQITADWCSQILQMGYQRQRAAAAIELAISAPGTPLFEVGAPGFRQQKILS